jgi:hypothetical protein
VPCFIKVGPSIDTPPRFTICGDSAAHLLVEDHHLDEARAAPAELARPVHADVSGFVHLLLPPAQAPDLVPVGARRGERLAFEIVRKVPLEPRADLLAEALLLFSEVEVHDILSRGMS